MNLNTPPIRRGLLTAEELSAEQSSGDDVADVPFLLVQPDDDCEPASLSDTVLVIGLSSVGLVAFGSLFVYFVRAAGLL